MDRNQPRRQPLARERGAFPEIAHRPGYRHQGQLCYPFAGTAPLDFTVGTDPFFGKESDPRLSPPPAQLPERRAQAQAGSSARPRHLAPGPAQTSAERMENVPGFLWQLPFSSLQHSHRAANTICLLRTPGFVSSPDVFPELLSLSQEPTQHFHAGGRVAGWPAASRCFHPGTVGLLSNPLWAVRPKLGS